MQLKFLKNSDVVTFLFFTYLKVCLSRMLPWVRTSRAESIYSEKYRKWFRSWSEYWYESGEREALVTIATSGFKAPVSFTWKTALVSKLSADFGKLPLVVLYNWDLTKIGSIEARFPGIKRVQFYDDYIVLPFLDLTSAKKTANSIPPSLSDCFLFYNGTELPL